MLENGKFCLSSVKFRYFKKGTFEKNRLSKQTSDLLMGDDIGSGLLLFFTQAMQSGQLSLSFKVRKQP